MRRDDVLKVLADHRAEVQRDFGVKSLARFGSTARNEASETSDIDLLVEFDRPTGYFGLVRLQQHLEGLLGCPVDLVTPGGLKASMKGSVLGEAIYVGATVAATSSRHP